MKDRENGNKRTRERNLNSGILGIGELIIRKSGGRRLRPRGFEEHHRVTEKTSKKRRSLAAKFSDLIGSIKNALG